jgi:hypothetical protein
MYQFCAKLRLAVFGEFSVKIVEPAKKHFFRFRCRPKITIFITRHIDS